MNMASSRRVKHVPFIWLTSEYKDGSLVNKQGDWLFDIYGKDGSEAFGVNRFGSVLRQQRGKLAGHKCN